MELFEAAKKATEAVASTNRGDEESQWLYAL